MDYRFENVNESENENQGYQPQYSYQPQPDSAPEAPQKPKKNRTGAKVTALVLSCALVGGAMGFGGSALQNHLAAKNADTEEAQQASVVYEGSRETSVINIAQIDTSKEMTPAEVYAQNVNSTVGIRTSITTNYWGYQTQAAAAGSGFILSADGYILTNYHVVEDSNSITVSLYDGTEYDATLVGCDESNDIAVLKIDAEGLTPVVLGDSDNLNVGDQVVAIGNPLGELTFSLTTGVVSALNREVTLSSNVTMNLIQTDCAINSGNSGGALFNLYGEVIGITNAKYSSSSSSSEASIDNIGFAIPLNHVKNIVKSIIETGSITKPYIGVTVSSVSSEAQGYGLPTGAAVRSVEADSPAAKAGLEENDIITEVDGTAINSSTELVNYVGEKTPGDELTFKVYRQGEELELTVTIGEKTQSAMPTTTTDDAQQSQQSQGQSQQGGQLFPWGFGFGY
ncbi:MAG: PDZ domain-containing protein [Oscillospiraceae bacterium]|nr:PDZ domain-containing protein [Oscillospiraceae bacterium]